MASGLVVVAVILYVVAIRTDIFDRVGGALTSVSSFSLSSLYNNSLEFIIGNKEVILCCVCPLISIVFLHFIWRDDTTSRKP